MTYGAGGSTRQRTREVVTWVRRETSITPMAHLTCQGHTRDEIAEILDDYRGGRHREHPRPRRRHPPATPATSGRATTRTPPTSSTTSTAATTSRSASPPTPRCTPGRRTGRPTAAILAAKLRRADFAITQFFFEAEHYLRLVDELARSSASTSRCCPGIMPITNAGQVAPDGPAERRRRAGVAASSASTASTIPPRCAGSASRSPPSCAPSCSRRARPGCTSTRSTAARRPGRSTPTSGSAATAAGED